MRGSKPMVVRADLMASNQRFDHRQKLPITNIFGISLIGISIEHTLPDIMHLLLQQLNFGRIHTSARRSRFGQSVCQTGQPVAPMGGATESPSNSSISGACRRRRDLGTDSSSSARLRRLPPLFAELLDLEPCLISSMMSRIVTIADQTVKGDDLIYIGEAFHRRCKVGRCGWLFI
jgi:hypothetical protein